MTSEGDAVYDTGNVFILFLLEYNVRGLIWRPHRFNFIILVSQPM